MPGTSRVVKKNSHSLPVFKQKKCHSLKNGKKRAASVQLKSESLKQKKVTSDE
jgi:hypothetical protein